MLKSLRVRCIKFLLDLIDHKYFNTRFVQVYKKLFPNIPSEKMVIFDVGGHEGEFIALFRKLFPNCQVHCFEPDPKSFHKIMEKFGSTKGVYLNNFGIGDVNARKKFYRNILSYTSSFNEIDLNSEWTKVKSKSLGVRPEQLIEAELELEIKTLDSYAKEHSIEKIHILKIDAEGYEVNCLKGSQQLLQSNRINTIQLELHTDDMYKNHYSHLDLENILFPHGYTLFRKETHLFLKCQELIWMGSQE